MQSFLAAEGFTRGRSYNIRMDDQVLLRFSPKNADSTYYFSDTVIGCFISSHILLKHCLHLTTVSTNGNFFLQIGGTLTFFHEEGTRRCLEVNPDKTKLLVYILLYRGPLVLMIHICFQVSVTLETLETINRRFVHPSRRNSPTLTKVWMQRIIIWLWILLLCFFRWMLCLYNCNLTTPYVFRQKVQSDHHEVVADLIQTSFLFSIPTDGPMSFSTPRVSVQWILRFEFLTTPKSVDLSRYYSQYSNDPFSGWVFWSAQVVEVSFWFCFVVIYRYEHPLLVPEREKSEWVLPITVHAPPPRTSGAQNRGDKLFGLEPSWIRS